MTPPVVLAEPFESVGYVVLDSLRLLIAAAGIGLAGYQLLPIRRSVTAGQRARFAGIAVALFVLAASRVQNLGGPVTWQFWGSLVAIALIGYGTWEWRNEAPAQPRRG